MHTFGDLEGTAMQTSHAMTKRAVPVGLAIAAGAFIFAGSTVHAKDAPNTADVLQELHQSDQKEIAAGKLAEHNGKSRQVKDYGKMLQKDHTAADKKVTALATQEKINLTESGTGGDMNDMATDPMFDTKFAQEMLGDHKKDIADVTDARDNTPDPKLKKLLTDLVPTLQKHEDAAQKIVDTETKK